MGESLIVRRGGSNSNSGKLFAAIVVTYPEGSTLTCSNGTKTLTAKTTTGWWVFAIPEAGTWTVTSTDPTGCNAPKSETVEITTEGQGVSVELSYVVNLLKTPGFELITNVEGYTCHLPTEGENWLEMTATYKNSTQQGHCVVRTKELVDLSKIKNLAFGIESATILNESYMIRLGISTNKQNGSSWPTFDAMHEIKSSASGTVVNLDVSSLSGEYYVFAHVQGSYNPTGTNKLKVNEILAK